MKVPAGTRSSGEDARRKRPRNNPFDSPAYGTRTPANQQSPLMPKGFEPELMDQWKTHDAVENYGPRHWGKGYFGINGAGHVTVHPNKRPEQSIDLKDLVDKLQTRGIQLPIL